MQSSTVRYVQSPVARTDLATCTGTITGTCNMYYSSTLRKSTYVLLNILPT